MIATEDTTYVPNNNFLLVCQQITCNQHHWSFLFKVLQCLKTTFLSATFSQAKSQGLVQREVPRCTDFLNANHDLVCKWFINSFQVGCPKEWHPRDISAAHDCPRWTIWNEDLYWKVYIQNTNSTKSYRQGKGIHRWGRPNGSNKATQDL